MPKSKLDHSVQGSVFLPNNAYYLSLGCKTSENLHKAYNTYTVGGFPRALPDLLKRGNVTIATVKYA